MTRPLPVKIGGRDRTVLLPPTQGATALIDADILCYQSAMDPSAYSERSHRLEDGNTEWSYHLNADCAFKAASDRIDQWCAILRASDTLLAWGSSSNWRRHVDPEYKAHRTDRKPLGYAGLRALLEDAFPSLSIPRLEADDVMGILATSAPDRYVIVSEDKDMATLPTRWWNPRSGEYRHSTPARARREHMKQTLTGDPADGYKGCPGIGAKTAAKILDTIDLDAEEAEWYSVLDAFHRAGLDERHAVRQAQVARILHADDYNSETGEIRLWVPPTQRSD